MIFETARNEEWADLISGAAEEIKDLFRCGCNAGLGRFPLKKSLWFFFAGCVDGCRTFLLRNSVFMFLRSIFKSTKFQSLEQNYRRQDINRETFVFWSSLLELLFIAIWAVAFENIYTKHEIRINFERRLRIPKKREVNVWPAISMAIGDEPVWKFYFFSRHWSNKLGQSNAQLIANYALDWHLIQPVNVRRCMHFTYNKPFALDVVCISCGMSTASRRHGLIDWLNG